LYKIWGGGGGRVNKEHYGLCENGEFANPAAVTRTCFPHDVTRASRGDDFQDLTNTQINVVVGSLFHWLFKRFRKIDFAPVISGCSVILWAGVFVLLTPLLPLPASLFLALLSLFQYLHVSKILKKLLKRSAWLLFRLVSTQVPYLF